MPFVALNRLSILLPALVAAFICGLNARAGAEALLLVDVETGKVLQAEHATQPWYPASVTKLMTTYVTLRALKEGRLKLDTLLTVSPNAVAQQPSKMGFNAGTQVTVDNAIKMLMVKSANDMAVVLAEGVSGSIDNFSDEMNKAAKRLGMTQTSYVNPNGLPADGQITSARDLAILARALIREFPEYDFYWHISAIKFGRRVMRNYNTLIDRYPGADGMKTGFICASGFNLVGTATRNGRRLIAVVLGAPSSPVRAVKAAQMLERGFATNSLSWLTPSLGNVEALTPIDAPPPNLRDEMCGKHRKRPAAESEDNDEADETVTAGAENHQSVQLSSLRAINHKPSSLIGPLTPSMEPIVVFVGPSKKIDDGNVATAIAKRTPAPKTIKAANGKPAAKSVAEKPANAKTAETKSAKAKRANAKPAKSPNAAVTTPAYAPTTAATPRAFTPAAMPAASARPSAQAKPKVATKPATSTAPTAQ